MNHLVIMAGGSGSRFWPLSTPERPKQFIDVLGTGQTLIQMTADRFRNLCAPERVWVVTSKDYVDLVRKQLPELPEENILAEPDMRNTAPCVAYVAWKIKEKDPDANLIISPADHLVTDMKGFEAIIRSGLLSSASSECIVTIGITPHRPETGYGYIEIESICEGEGVYKVNSFKEKPSFETATRYVNEKCYYWNSGIFICNIKAIQKAYRKFQPEMALIFDQVSGSFFTAEEQPLIDSYYPFCESISIDYAIMEHAENIYMIPASVGWSDLGTWRAFYDLSDKDSSGNVKIGDSIKLVDSENCLIFTSLGKQCVIEGLRDYIVVETQEALLIIRKENNQAIKDWKSLCVD